MGSTTAERLAERLVSFLAELPEDEKALLLAVLVDAGGEAEVSGYDFHSLWSSLPVSGPGGGEAVTSVLTNIANMKHETLKAVAQNLRG